MKQIKAAVVWILRYFQRHKRRKIFAVHTMTCSTGAEMSPSPVSSAQGEAGLGVFLAERAIPMQPQALALCTYIDKKISFSMSAMA
jgi:hypothetical protein